MIWAGSIDPDATPSTRDCMKRVCGESCRSIAVGWERGGGGTGKRGRDKMDRGRGRQHSDQ